MALSPWQLCFHTDLKCRVRTCSNRRIMGGSSSSLYCRHHACTVCLKFKTCFKRGHGEDKICHHREFYPPNSLPSRGGSTRFPRMNRLPISFAFYS
ncbi:hypothetical protein F5Y11DRAFT_332680 [Daldinia sp. FL1419]|nr:hypothetical protein F5Y11DRAFT_332680 [Daldinia sp. FL1419]